MSVEPEFVMLGVREPDGTCAIYASSEFRHADLIAHREYPLAVIAEAASRGIDPRELPPQRFDLEATLTSYVKGTGASYAEALLDLMARWSPPDARTASLVGEFAAIQGGYIDGADLGIVHDRTLD